MKTFFIVWLGQLGSVIGSALTGFALGVYVYQRNESATEYALVQFCSQCVFFLATPFAGVLVDKWNRRWAMMLSDTGAGLCTLVIFLLVSNGRLEIPTICFLVSLSAGFNALQYIAYKAAVTQMVAKENYGRAAGMVEMAGGIAHIVAPVLAGFLIGIIHLQGIILIDVGTFTIALICLIVIRIPDTATSKEGQDKQESFWKSAFFGWGYVRKRPGLFQLLLYFAVANFLMSTVVVLATPMVLSMSSPKMLGTLLTCSGLGLLCGGLTMSAWGGPKRLVNGIFTFQFICGLAVMLVGVSSSLVLITIGGFIFFYSLPIVTGCSQAIWQRKVPQDLQGRVFSMRQMIAFSAIPLAYGISGPLADQIFEPLMASGGALSTTVGAVLGSGPGRGIGLIFVIYGTTFALFSLSMWRNKTLRNIETDIPDADQETQTPETTTDSDAL